MKRTEYDDNSLVVVTNDYTATLIYKTDRISRVFDKGTFKKVTLGELYEAVNTGPGRVLMERNMLLIKDEEVRERLGLPPLNPNYDLTLKQIEDLIDSEPKEKLEDVLQHCSDATLHKIVDVAISMPVENVSKANLIQAYTGKDIIELGREFGDQENNSPRTPNNKPTTTRKRVIKT